MCNNPNWSPIEFSNEKNQNQIEGIAIDTLKILEKRLNITFQNVPTTSWSQSQQYLKEKKCDILPAAIKTAKRENYAIFTKPYLDYKLAIITKNDKPFINGIDDIIDKSISRKKGSGLIHKLKNRYPNINIVETKGYIEALQKVSNGEVYCTIATLPVASYYIQQFALHNLQIAGYTNMRYKLSIAVRDDYPELLTILNKSLNTITKDEQIKIYNKWASVEIHDGYNYQFIWKITGITFIILLFFIYRQYILKESNQNLKQAVEDKTKDLIDLNKHLEVKIKDEVNKNLQIQEQLFKSEKMAAMGEMIGNIAHQWRQPLSIISTAATGMQFQKQYGVLSDEQFNDACTNINDNAQYLSKTIDDFKNFIKGDRTKKRFDLKDEIESFLNLVNGSIKNNHINMILDLDSKIEINGYKNELTQCLINIFNNAKDALKEIDDETNRFIFLSTKKENDTIIIIIKDSGGGIPKNIISKIFEPYFTTKHQSQGTGLGLNMTYNLIVDGMSGSIDVDNKNYEFNNKKHSGAEFRITLPLS